MKVIDCLAACFEVLQPPKPRESQVKRHPLSREQFIAQFPVKVDKSIEQYLFKAEPHPVQYEGVEVFRALERLVIKVDGQYRLSR